MANTICPNGHDVEFADPDPSFVQIVATDGGPGGTSTKGTIEHDVVVVKCPTCGAVFEVAVSPEGETGSATRHTVPTEAG